MAQHKAPTAITIAPIQEKSGLAVWVDRYWKLALLAAVAATAVVLYLQHRKKSVEVEHDQSWDKLMAVANENPSTGGITGDVADLKAVADQVQGKQAGPWALYIGATSALEKQDFDGASEFLARLRREYPDHSLLHDTFRKDATSPPVTVAAQLQSQIDTQKAWRAAHAELFQNPELPADAPKVKINTDKGSITVGFYNNLAPKHVANFLELAKKDFYKGVKFHRVVSGFMIQAGDPNTIQGDVTTWGQGGPGYKIDREETHLRHFPGFFAAAKMGGDAQSSGSQFYITTGNRNQLDGQYVVYGKVLEGMDVAHVIEKGAVVQGTDRPEEPATIQSVEILSGG